MFVMIMNVSVNRDLHHGCVGFSIFLRSVSLIHINLCFCYIL